MKDDDFLIYENDDRSQRTTAKIRKRENGVRIYVETVETLSRRGAADHRGGALYVVDVYGVVLGPADPKSPPKEMQRAKDRLIKSWLPTKKRKLGTAVPFAGLPGTVNIEQQQRFERWMVWVGRTDGHEYYYDQASGFLVGWTSSGTTWKLVSSNLHGLR